MSIEPMSIEEKLAAARTRLDALRREADAAATEIAQFSAHIEQSTHSAWSRDRSVRVSLGGDALVKAVEFTEQALSMSPRSLATATLDAHGRAVSRFREAVEDAVNAAPDSARGLTEQVLAATLAILPPPDDPRDELR